MIRVININEALKTANFKCDSCATEQINVNVKLIAHGKNSDGTDNVHILKIACSNVTVCKDITFYPDEGGELSKKLHEVHNLV